LTEKQGNKFSNLTGRKTLVNFGMLFLIRHSRGSVRKLKPWELSSVGKVWLYEYLIFITHLWMD